MPYQLDLDIQPTEGALLRVLGTAERRGFRATGIFGEIADLDAQRCWHIQSIGTADHPVATICQYLSKLVDCLSVHASPVELA